MSAVHPEMRHSTVSSSVRHALGNLISAAVAAADPTAAISKSVTSSLDCVGQLNIIGSTQVHVLKAPFVTVLAAGKAAVAMASALLHILDGAGVKELRGVCLTKDDHASGATAAFVRERISLLEASHPTPDCRGSAAARRFLDAAYEASSVDGAVVFVLLSGGGSALLPLPAPPLTLDDLIRTNDALLASGASIDEVNCVRKHCSAISGGQLATAAGAARVVTLALSDVPHDKLAVIASGPTVPDPTTFADALRVLDKYPGLRGRLPEAVLTRFDAGASGSVAETMKATRPQDIALVVGSNARSLDAVASAAARLGYAPIQLTGLLHGEAGTVGRLLAAIAASRARPSAGADPVGSWVPWAEGRPLCLVAGGETTVTLGSSNASNGRGGRNMELALAAAVSLGGDALCLDADVRVFVASVGTDGTDGPTDAAGAVVSPATTRIQMPRRADSYLFAHDSWNFFLDCDKALAAQHAACVTSAHSSADDESADVRVGCVSISPAGLITTGPTGTNVMDICICLVGAP